MFEKAAGGLLFRSLPMGSTMLQTFMWKNTCTDVADQHLMDERHLQKSTMESTAEAAVENRRTPFVSHASG